MTALTRADRRLAGGVVALEFAAAVSAFVSATLLPTVAGALDARDHLGLLLAGSTLGLFVALPLAPAVLHRLGGRRTLLAGLLAYAGGAAVAATALTPWTYAAGRVAGGIGGGLLAVFGVSAVIRQLDEAVRAKVVAASSAMWILPAFVGPPGTLALQHAVGWRWALLAPLPVVLAGRLLVAGAALDADEPAPRPVGRTLLIPAGVAVLLLTRRPELVALGAAVALVGVAGVLPAGTARLARGRPAALGAMLLFGTGWFGADGLVTVLLTDGYGTSVARAAVVLSAAPLAWAVTSLVATRRVHPAAGLALAAAGVAVLAATDVYGIGLAAWTLAGVGIGLAYPGLYVRCTTSDRPAEAATAVLTAEAFGQLLGLAAGGVAASLAGLVPAYLALAVVLAAAAVAALRA
ncbi:MAG TPA: MFS transporter [Mycobacteriales bacterium]|nr:MFS transporter [Mycobacteriales bacterium]